MENLLIEIFSVFFVENIYLLIFSMTCYERRNSANSTQSVFEVWHSGNVDKKTH
jgi:hypothetical protein